MPVKLPAAYAWKRLLASSALPAGKIRRRVVLKQDWVAPQGHTIVIEQWGAGQRGVAPLFTFSCTRTSHQAPGLEITLAMGVAPA